MVSSRTKGGLGAMVLLAAALAVGGACTSLLDVDGYEYAAGGAGTGGSGAVGGSSGTGGDGCDPAGCPGIDRGCRWRICDRGACSFEVSAVGDPCTEEGGVVCDGNGACVECVDQAQCQSGESCQLNQCVPASCTNGVKDGGETDIDCGGAACAPCANGQSCGGAGDCQSGLCSGGTCSACTSSTQCAPGKYCEGGACQDAKQNGASCTVDEQCQSGHCPSDDHVCCATACAGLCDACLQSKSGDPNGTCSDVTAGTDPDGECSGSTCDGGNQCAPVCGQSPDAPGQPSCPGVCSSCMDTPSKLCTINCGLNNCQGGPINCPSGYDCLVNCNDTGSCQGVSINCPAEYQCNVACSSADACGNATLNCQDGPCNVLCGHDTACTGMGVNCGTNLCGAACPGNASPPNLLCGQACVCAPC